MTALVGAAGNFRDGFDLMCLFWLPQEGVEDLERRHGQPYRQWAAEKLIVLTAGSAIDYDFIEAAIVDIATRYRLIKLMADPWNGKKLCESLLNKHGLPVEYLRQGYASLSDPTKTLLEAGGVSQNPPWWTSRPAVAHIERNGAIGSRGQHQARQVEASPENRRSGCAVNAIGAAIASGDVEEPSVYETRGALFVDNPFCNLFRRPIY